MRLIVIGGGAAGFFCAVNAARINPGLEVIIVEKTGKLLSKVRISGGGRCNVTHACFSIPDIIKKYPRGKNFVKKAFHQFFTEDTISWFKDRRVLLKTEEDGRMFPVTDNSSTIIDCLLREADHYAVQIRMNSEVKDISKNGEEWKITFGNGETTLADFICVACGGYPKSSMFEWLLKTGHSIEDPVPSLFTFNIPGHPVTGLMGIAAKAKIRIPGMGLEEEGPVLITHWGLSGPAVLRMSARGARDFFNMDYRFEILINWSPAFHEQSLKEKFGVYRLDLAARKVTGRNEMDIPQRLWIHLCGLSEIDESVRWADLPSAKENKLVRNICAMKLEIRGKTTFKEEFVTAGGIRLSEIDPSTMQSRLASRLFFAGEILDVDGMTGGFNFQHAWTSGWIAANNIGLLSRI